MEAFFSRAAVFLGSVQYWHSPRNEKPVLCPLLYGKLLSFENTWWKHDHGLWCQELLSKQINFLHFQVFVQVVLHCFVTCNSFSHTASSLPPQLDLLYSFSVCAVQFIFYHNLSFWLLPMFLSRCWACLSESKAFGSPLTEGASDHDGRILAQRKTSAGCGSPQLLLTAQCWDFCSKSAQEKVRHQIKVWERKWFLPHAFPRGVCICIYTIYSVQSYPCTSQHCQITPISYRLFFSKSLGCKSLVLEQLLVWSSSFLCDPALLPAGAMSCGRKLGMKCFDLSVCSMCG